MNNIMIVCIGNICRSPVAEAFLKQLLPEKNIYSAGLGALVGHRANPISSKLAELDGIDLSNHIAQQINALLCKKADLILVMETGHKKEIEKQYPYTKGKVHCLGRINPQIIDEINDPYKQDEQEFLKSHEKIKKYTTKWAQLIKEF